MQFTQFVPACKTGGDCKKGDLSAFVVCPSLSFLRKGWYFPYVMSQCTWLLVDTFCVTEDRYFLKVHLKSGESCESGEYRKIATCFGWLHRNFPEFLGLFWACASSLHESQRQNLGGLVHMSRSSGLCSLQPRKWASKKSQGQTP